MTPTLRTANALPAGNRSLSRRSPRLHGPANAREEDSYDPLGVVVPGIRHGDSPDYCRLFPVMPEETYHWNYARHPDWGYFDHPPMVAWGIGAGSALLGDNRLGIRLGPLLFSLGATLVLARLARRLYGREAANWVVLLLALEPAASIVGSWGFPDSPLLFFWALALLGVWRALESGQGAWWLAAGAALGAGMLSKYTTAFLVPSMLGYLLTSRRDRRWLGTPWPYLAGVASLVVFLPVFYWNWQHDWASFRFQGPARFRNANGFSVLAGLNSAAEQWLFILPITLPLAGAALVRLVRAHQPREQFLLWSFAPTVLFFLVMGTTPSFHLLWPLPAYLGLTVAMAGAVADPLDRVARAYAARRGWLAGSVAATLIACAVYAGQLIPFLPPFEGPYGWDEVAARARTEAAKLPPGSFIVGISSRPYLCASELAYHMQMPASVQANNILGMEGLQYRFWADLGRLAGRDALVVSEGSLQVAVRPLLSIWFETVEPLGDVVVNSSPGRKTLHCCMYRARGYRPMPFLALPKVSGDAGSANRDPVGQTKDVQGR